MPITFDRSTDAYDRRKAKFRPYHVENKFISIGKGEDYLSPPDIRPRILTREQIVAAKLELAKGLYLAKVHVIEAATAMGLYNNQDIGPVQIRTCAERIKTKF